MSILTDSSAQIFGRMKGHKNELYTVFNVILRKL